MADFPRVLTIFGALGVTFIVAMYALERGHRGFLGVGTSNGRASTSSAISARGAVGD